MGVRSGDIKNNPLLDAVLGEKPNEQPASAPVKKQSVAENPLLVAVNSQKKNLGGGEPVTESEKDFPIPSVPPSDEKQNNSFTDQLQTWFERGKQAIADKKAEEEENSTVGKETTIDQARKQGGLAILKKTTAIEAPNGVKLDLDTKVVSPNYSTHNFNSDIEAMQQRINSGTVRPEDIGSIATMTKKTPEAVTEYLKGNTTKGLAIDNVENQKKLKTDLTNAVFKYNETSGENLVPEDILSSADKTTEFIQKLKEQRIKSQKENIAIPETWEGKSVLAKNVLDPESLISKFSEYQELLKQHVVKQTIQEDEKAGVPKEQTIKNIYRRMNPTEYYRSIKANIPVTATPLNPLASGGQMLDRIFGTQEKDDLLNSQQGIAEFAYNNQQKQIANNEISEGIVTGDENLVNIGKARMSATDSDSQIYQKYPALLKQKIAQEVSKELAFRSGQMKNSETQDYSIKFFGADAEDIANTDAFKKYMDNTATKDIAESMLNHTDLFSDASYLGGMWDSFKQSSKELGMFVMDITQLRSPKDIYADKIKDEMFPKETEGTKADFTILNHPFKVRTALNTTANLTGMMAIAAVTEGAAGGLGATANTAKSLGAYTSVGLPSYDAALKESYNFLDNDAARTLYATLTAVTNAEGGRFLDLGKIVRIPGVSDAYAKMAEGLSKGTLSKTATKELLGEAKNAYIDFAVKYGKNVSKGAATMAYFNISNNIEKIAFGDPNIKSEDVLPQAAHAFMDGVLGMSVMGAFGAVADMRAEKNTTYKGFIYNMALNHDAAKDVFQTGLKNGTYTQEQYNEKVQILNTARVAKNAMDAAQVETNTILNENQKSVYVANKTAEAVLREKAADKTASEVDRDRYLTQADRLRKQSEDVLKGLKFSPTLEPLYDLYNAEKEYDQALSDFNENKGSERALERAKTNYDQLINKYFSDKSKQVKKSEALAPKEQPPVISEEAHNAIEEGIKSGDIPKMEAEMLNTTENKIQFLKEVAQQAKGELANGEKVGEGGAQGKEARKKYGDGIVDEALKMFPIESKEVKDIADTEISKTAAEAAPFIPKEQSDQVKSVFDRVNNAEQINEKELADTENVLYDVLDKHPNAAHLIEPLISKIQDYEFATKTETGTVTEEVSTETPRQTRKREPVSKNLDQWEGNRATTTDANGKQVSGVLRIENGKYSLYNENGEKVAALGEKAITDRDITLPSSEDVPMPIQIDKDGNVKSITLQLNKVDKENGGIVPDKQITIEFKDTEKALDYAIALRAEQIGEIDPKKFDMAYEEVQKEVSREVPKSENKPIQSEQSSSTVSSEGVSGSALKDVGDVEYNDFIDKGKVSEERLNDIAEKVKTQQPLSDREKEIFTDKTAEINKIISKAPTQYTEAATPKSENKPIQSEQSSSTVSSEKNLEVIDALDNAAQSKKSMREKDKAMEAEAEKHGELGKKILDINRNFDKIVSELKKLNKIEVKCP